MKIYLLMEYTPIPPSFQHKTAYFSKEKADEESERLNSERYLMHLSDYQANEDVTKEEAIKEMRYINEFIVEELEVL